MHYFYRRAPGKNNTFAFSREEEKYEIKLLYLFNGEIDKIYAIIFSKKGYKVLNIINTMYSEHEHEHEYIQWTSKKKNISTLSPMYLYF